ncbi:hypothetical protein D7004_10630 [Pedobacter jejuensis]|uniref:Uncharacterized protein n=1 Tax=Pedobacter jejuensis TaxID=1268550 RepID=A0A3N0BUJ3_9SPHI|nr:hypothetical protein D7004_10630 [Pedobacter jejuensis]
MLSNSLAVKACHIGSSDTTPSVNVGWKFGTIYTLIKKIRVNIARINNKVILRDFLFCNKDFKRVKFMGFNLRFLFNKPYLFMKQVVQVVFEIDFKN